MAKDDHILPIQPPLRRVPDPPKPTWPPVTPSPGVVNAAAKQFRIGGAAAAGSVLPIIYGRQRVQGRVFYYQPYLPTGSPIYVGVTIGVGEIQEVEAVRVNGYPLPAGGISGLTYSVYLGTTAGEADARVYTEINSISYANWKFPGVAYAVFEINPSLIPFESIESFAFDVKGLKVYDFRTATTAYSANAVLCIWDFLTHTRHGCKRSTALMDDDSAAASWWVSADLADEVVDGEPRYELNIAITEQATGESLLELLRAHCAADIFFQKGKYRCVLESARSATLSFDDSSNCRDVVVRTLPSVDKPTSVTITFPNPAKDYEDDTARFPEGVVSGVQLGEATYRLTGCTSAKQAKRLAAIYQRKGAFEEYPADFIAGPEAVRLMRRDIINLTSRDGLSAQPMDVLDMEEIEGGEYRLSVREHDSATYSDDPQATDTLVSVSGGNPFETPRCVPYVVQTTGFTQFDTVYESGSLLNFSTTIYWEGPRAYVSALYGASYWSLTGAATGDTAKVNDGDLVTQAVDFSAAGACGLKFDAGAGNTRRFGGLVITGLDSELLPWVHFKVEHSDDDAAWTEVNVEQESTSTVSGLRRTTTFEWEDAGAHRYWRVEKIVIFGNTLALHEVQFLETTAFNDEGALSHYELTDYVTGAFLTTIPTANRPTSTAPLNVEPFIRQSGALDAPTLSLTIEVKAVTTANVKSVGVRLTRVRSGAELTNTVKSAAVMRQTGATPTTPQAGSDELVGTRKGATLHATSRLLLDSAPSAPVSGAGQIALRDNAGALEQSVNGGAYAALGGASLTVKESDGSPSVANVTEIRLTGATVTDEGGGAVTVAVTAGAGGVNVLHDLFTGAGGASQVFTLSANLATSDEESVINVIWGDGVHRYTSEWAVTAANQITATPAPPSGTNVQIDFFGTLPTGVTGVHVEVDTGDDVTTDFPLAQTAIPNGLVAAHVAQVPKSATLISGGTAVRYAVAPPSGDTVETTILY